MTYENAIKRGMALVHSNWQLVLVHFSAVVITLIAAIVMIGVPIFLIVVLAGVNPAALERLGRVIESGGPVLAEMMRFAWLMAAFIFMLLLYITLSYCLWAFVKGGTLGVLGRAAHSAAQPFSLDEFMSHGKRLWGRVLLYEALFDMAYIAIAAAVSATGFVLYLGWKANGATEAAIAALGIFALAVMISAALIIALFAVKMQGVVHIALEDSGAWDAIKAAASRLADGHGTAGLAGLLMLAFVAVQAVVLMFMVSVEMIPIFGSLISLPLNIAARLLSIYLGLIMVCAMIEHYTGASGEGSSGETHISEPEAQEPSDAPAQTEPTE